MRICALIPAYNEENTITEIIKTLARVELIDQIVVVDDGSEDDTTPVARAAGAEVIQMPENKGKGAAIMRGVESVEADVFLLLDGDLIGLNQEHVENLLAPVLEDGVDMAVGLFNEGRGLTDLAQYFAPNLSGQRAVKVEILEKIDDLDKEGFGVELLLNSYVKKNGQMEFVSLPELTHVMKEEKMGLCRGIKARLVMYWEILKTIFYRIIKKQKNRKK